MRTKLAKATTLAALLCTPTQSHAFWNYFVNTTNDTPDNIPGDLVCADAAGNCSVRAAIEEANANAFGGVIHVPPGTYALTAGALQVTGPNPVGALLGYTSATGTPATIDAGGASRVLEIDPLIDFSVANMVLTGGLEPTGYGGCVDNDGNLTLTRVTVENCSAPALSGQGGGIASGVSSTLTILNNSVIADNDAGEHGGGITTEDFAVLTIEDSTIEDNVAGSSGGGVYVGRHNTATIERSTIRSNTDGGLNVNMGTTIDITYTRLHYNTGFAGIRAVGTAVDRIDMTVYGSLLYGNTDGGVWLDNVDARIERASIAFNTGTGLYVDDATVDLVNSTIADNTRGIDTSSFFPPSTIDISSSTILNNGSGLPGSCDNVDTYAGSLTLRNSVSGLICSNGITSAGWNLFDDQDPLDFLVSQPTDLGVGAPLDPDMTPVDFGPGGGWGYVPNDPSSPAIDSGDPAGCTDGTTALTTDQRGWATRHYDWLGGGAICDRGAIELQP